MQKLRDRKNLRKSFSTSRIIILGFLLVILIGSLLLMLPFSTREAGGASFWDALFTATSAVCVTGLVVQDTATYWSQFGQLIILLLIQIGGMGVVTISVAFAVISGRRIGLLQRSTMQEAISAPHIGGIVRMTSFILKVTFLAETVGALLLAPVFCRDFGFAKGVWYAVFHSVSAFCNAGFDLMGVREPFSSLTDYRTDPLVNLVIMGLIILGGIGFLIWEDVRTNRLHFRKYRMQTKTVLAVTAALILLSALYYFFVEFSAPQWSNLSASERFWGALFQAVTPRTAGYNTLDLTKLSGAGLTIMIFLMLVGGSPGSTAGGMKTTTVAVLIGTAFSVFRRKEDICFFKRRIADAAVRNAVAILMLYMSLFVTAALLISGIENLPMSVCLFETASAVGTVGLTLGITPTLGFVSRLILIFLMFLGRVGGLTLIYAALSGTRSDISRAPLDRMTVG
ncbi:TrkH family potassium uptake protein [Marvinbryantia formatexigens DSM 14469]|nr:TrkH family potassium uptake protein [Marvinbryantia formatexigens]UWO26935.1 TrkH family potassium uptake protein [Marvinbryantia formatexigens DSM 14469]